MSFDLSSSFPHFKIPMVYGGKSGTYEFDDFRLDAENLMLYRCDDEISLPPKVVKTLSVLVEKANSIVAKDDLIDTVWPDAIVEEASLSQHLYLLRKTLGTRPDGHPYIETLRRRGYRFNGDVRFVQAWREMPVPVTPDQPPVSVERQGNVLRLVDWKVAPENVSKSTPVAVQQAFVHRGYFLPRLAVCAAILLVALAPMILYWYWPSSAASGANARELVVLPLTNGLTPIDATISTDGDYFAYHESDGEVSQLWVQQVGQSNRIEIGKSSDKLYRGKTFSPDGRFVYYEAVDKSTNQTALYRVPTLGGPHTKLLNDIIGPVSFSSTGDEIAFLRIKEGVASSLIIADKDGRNEKVLFDVAYPRRIVGPPSWSPSGKLLAFAEADLSKGTLTGCVSILGIDLESGERQSLSNEEWDTVYRIVWTADGEGFLTIATRESEGMSPWRDQVYHISYPGGSSRRLTNEGNRHQVWALGVTNDNAVVTIPFSRSAQIWSLDPNDPEGVKQISTGGADGRAGLAVLPNGRIGYIAQTGGQLNIWIMNPDGTGAKQLTNDPPILEELRSDPQGRYFIFSAAHKKQSALFRIDTDGGNLKQLTTGDGYAGDSAISPDGNWVVYTSLVLQGSSEHPELWKISIDGGEPVKFSDEFCASPNFSPDGSMVSCIRDEREILVLSAEDGRRIETFALPPHSVVNSGAGWTADGSSLTYIRLEKNVSNLWIQPRTGKQLTKLTNFTSGFVTRYAFFADGSRLIVSRGYPQHDAILIKNFR